MPITKRILTELGVSATRADAHLSDLAALLPEHGIDTPLRLAHFLAQVLHESGLLSVVEENLRYTTASRLRAIFPTYFTPAQAAQYAGSAQAIGNRVYANRLGNGDEASGDGYRYRGRGLIQLTGKANYRRFGEWIGDDVVASPDLVKSTYPVHCAVFFWGLRDLNGPADADDLREVTRRVNGGFIGLPHRLQLLDRAKQVLRHEGPGAVVEGATHIVTATQLNLRRAPQVTPATRIATLPQGTPVALIADGPDDWARVRAALGAQLVEGFVKAVHLGVLARARGVRAASAARRVLAAVPAVHLAEGRREITRRRDGGHAHPLGEAGMPRRTATAPDRRAAQILEIVAYLDSENRAHARYGPTSTATYCNIYAYDLCYLARAYLPRVFWTAAAVARLQAGERLPVRYDDTVRELNANALHDWLADFGPRFGWVRVPDLDVLQAAANGGEVCLVVAKRKDTNRSGHIVAVVAEHERMMAVRGADGTVQRPVESQAGATNHRLIVKPSAWWRGAQFSSFAFWRHA